MATRRLYWEEPHARTFTGRILRVFLRDGRLAAVLDRTLFYPEGGGQPCDRGHLFLADSDLSERLGQRELVVAGVEEENGEIIHMLDTEGLCLDDLRQGSLDPDSPCPGGLEYPEGGYAVRGTIDRKRRSDFMQQHSGQHILSRAFEEVLDARTVGFHLSDDYVSVDLDIGLVSSEDVDRVEDRANEVVFQDVPVFAREYAKDDLPSGVRSRFGVEADRIRVIYIGDFDACPCAGTHLTSSGQVGLIKVNQTDRAHGGVRVVFRCGGRALADYREKQSLLDDAARILSRPVHDVPEAILATLNKFQDVQERLTEAQEALLDFEIEALLRPERAGASESIVACLSGKSPDQLKYVARRVSDRSGRLTVCFQKEPRFSAVVVSRKDAGPDARKVAEAISQVWGGRGGGTREMAQIGSKEPLVADNVVVEDGITRICRELRLF